MGEGERGCEDRGHSRGERAGRKRLGTQGHCYAGEQALPERAATTGEGHPSSQACGRKMTKAGCGLRFPRGSRDLCEATSGTEERGRLDRCSASL